MSHRKRRGRSLHGADAAFTTALADPKTFTCVRVQPVSRKWMAKFKVEIPEKNEKEDEENEKEEDEEDAVPTILVTNLSSLLELHHLSELFGCCGEIKVSWMEWERGEKERRNAKKRAGSRQERDMFPFLGLLLAEN
jgi:hypothetical protein